MSLSLQASNDVVLHKTTSFYRLPLYKQNKNLKIKFLENPQI